jgi:hypothetical protein
MIPVCICKSPEPLTWETESLTQVVVSQTQIAESQTQVFESPRLCNHASMHNAPKQFTITLPNPQTYHNTSSSNTIYNIQNSQPQHTVTQFISHSTYNIQFSKISLISSTYSKVLKSTKTDIFNIQLVRIYKTTYIFCNSLIYKNSSFSVSRILTLAALDSWLQHSLVF